MGFVVFTGSETKLMMNSQKGRFKQSKMEVMMNNLVLYIILTQIVLCSIVSIVGSFWYTDKSNRKYYLTFQFSVSVNGVISFFSFFLLFATLLPISLIVTLELVKVVQSYYIMCDYLMYSEERMKFARVSTTSIVEELGQVSYIFSDKTGTLTRNVMEFKLLHVGGTLFGNPADLDNSNPLDPKASQHHQTHDGTKDLECSFKSVELENLLLNKTNKNISYKVKSTNGKVEVTFNTQRDLVIEFFKVLSLAHECVPETIKKADGTSLTFF